MLFRPRMAPSSSGHVLLGPVVFARSDGESVPLAPTVRALPEQHPLIDRMQPAAANLATQMRRHPEFLRAVHRLSCEGLSGQWLAEQ
jgi:hypothetical protein